MIWLSVPAKLAFKRRQSRQSGCDENHFRTEVMANHALYEHSVMVAYSSKLHYIRGTGHSGLAHAIALIETTSETISRYINRTLKKATIPQSCGRDDGQVRLSMKCARLGCPYALSADPSLGGFCCWACYNRHCHGDTKNCRKRHDADCERRELEHFCQAPSEPEPPWGLIESVLLATRDSETPEEVRAPRVEQAPRGQDELLLRLLNDDGQHKKVQDGESLEEFANRLAKQASADMAQVSERVTELLLLEGTLHRAKEAFPNALHECVKNTKGHILATKSILDAMSRSLTAQLDIIGDVNERNAGPVGLVIRAEFQPLFRLLADNRRKVQKLWGLANESLDR